jgi:hypothetical protein
MKVLKSIKSGLFRSLKSWKGVLIIWICFLLLVSIYALPLRNMVRSGFGPSMITGRFVNGLDVEAFSDLGSTLRSLMSYISAGFLMVFLIGIVVNSFLTGGLFNSLRKEYGNMKFSPSEFFRAGAVNFWSFLIISLIINLMTVFISAIIVFIPSAVVTASETMSEKSAVYIIAGAVLFAILLLPVFLLVADYSRAWKVCDEKRSCFKALGFGFSETFRKFWQAYLMMLGLVLIQVVFGWIVYSILSAWKPASGGGVFLLFLVSQMLVYIKFHLKTWRYGSVMSLMENNQKPVVQNSVIQDNIFQEPIVQSHVTENPPIRDPEIQDPLVINGTNLL